MAVGSILQHAPHLRGPSLTIDIDLLRPRLAAALGELQLPGAELVRLITDRSAYDSEMKALQEQRAEEATLTTTSPTSSAPG